MLSSVARTLSLRTSGNASRISAASFAASTRRFISIKPLYTAEATSTGGRNGRAVSSDNVVNVSLSLPKELGGPGEAGKTNPEQLFAAGYSACFQGAMGVAAQKLGVKLPESNTVRGRVHIGTDNAGGLGLAVELLVQAPGLEKETTQKVVDLAHTICPYSRATSGNIDVKLSVV